MNPFKEYLQLTKRGIQNFDKVFEGIRNDVSNKFKLLSKEKKEVIAERMDICINCPYNSRNAPSSDEYKSLTGEHYTTNRSELHCSFCGCTVPFKVSSLNSNCGAETWNEENPDNQIELKWTQYIKNKKDEN
jgi:hypothetical protein